MAREVLNILLWQECVVNKKHNYGLIVNFLQCGADPNYIHNNYSLLHAVLNNKIAIILLDHGADPQKLTKDKKFFYQPCDLHVDKVYRHTNISYTLMCTMLKAGFDVKVVDITGENTIDYLVAHRQVDALFALMEYQIITNEEFMLVLPLAFSSLTDRIIRYFIKTPEILDDYREYIPDMIYYCIHKQFPTYYVGKLLDIYGKEIPETSKEKILRKLKDSIANTHIFGSEEINIYPMKCYTRLLYRIDFKETCIKLGAPPFEQFIKFCPSNRLIGKLLEAFKDHGYAFGEIYKPVPRSNYIIRIIYGMNNHRDFNDNRVYLMFLLKHDMGYWEYILGNDYVSASTLIAGYNLLQGASHHPEIDIKPTREDYRQCYNMLKKYQPQSILNVLFFDRIANKHNIAELLSSRNSSESRDLFTTFKVLMRVSEEHNLHYHRIVNWNDIRSEFNMDAVDILKLQLFDIYHVNNEPYCGDEPKLHLMDPYTIIRYNGLQAIALMIWMMSFTDCKLPYLPREILRIIYGYIY